MAPGWEGGTGSRLVAECPGSAPVPVRLVMPKLWGPGQQAARWVGTLCCCPGQEAPWPMSDLASSAGRWGWTGRLHGDQPRAVPAPTLCRRETRLTGLPAYTGEGRAGPAGLLATVQATVPRSPVPRSQVIGHRCTGHRPIWPFPPDPRGNGICGLCSGRRGGALPAAVPAPPGQRVARGEL